MTPEEMAAHAIALATPEAQAQMSRAMDEVTKAFESMRKARQISFEDLNRPVTI